MVAPLGLRPPLLATLLVALGLAGCSGGGAPDEGGGLQVDDEDFNDLGLDADSNTGILRGVVIDEAIRPLAGAAVTALGAGGANVTMTTHDDGLFGFDRLEPGTYFVSVAKVGYVPTQTSAEVVANVDDPEPVKILLAADPATRPYVQPYHLDGYIGCSIRPMLLAYQCPGITATNVVNANYDDMPATPDWIQSEMRWESTQAVGDELSLAIRCLPGDTDPADRCPDGQRTIARSEGVSPLVATINRTLASNWTLGGPEGNPLSISIFVFGRSDLDVYDEETVDSAQQPVTGKPCLDWNGVVFPAGTCVRATGPGLVLNQKVDVYTHVFYGYLPPEGWTFGADGEPPGPPA